MIKKITTLFIIGRKLALSEVLNIVSKVHKIPFSLVYWVYLEKKTSIKI